MTSKAETFAAVSDSVTRAVLSFAASLEPEFGGAAVAEIILGAALGLFARDLGPPAAVARLREIATELEAAAVNPNPGGRTN